MSGAGLVLSETSSIIRNLGRGGQWELRRRGYHLMFAVLIGVQGFYFLLTGQVPFPHLCFVLGLHYASAIGVAAGAHRLWSHRSYKAKLPLRIILMLMQTLASHDSLFSWVRNHRLHHKYSETDADPHNIRRGFFFSHVGWWMVKEHPKVTEKEKSIDLADLQADPVVAFQHKYMWALDLILYHALPILVPYYLWLPSLYTCLAVNYLRFVVSSNVASMGNSVAHSWTRKPYEKSGGPADVTWLSLIIMGEGWHNFHHTFPWDYRSTDVGLYFYNPATIIIDMMARIGWAYDLKTVPDHVIRKRAARTGDGSHPFAASHKNNEALAGSKNSATGDFNNQSIINKEMLDKLDVGGIGPAPWGWGDSDIPPEDIQETIIVSCGRS